jgi:redox-sensitive bicupin YhaK (pirin superfamily)
MSDVISANIDFWKSFAEDKAANRPVPGTAVRVLAGAHKGREGRVTQHMRSRYFPWRYVPPGASHAMEIEGRAGFVCRVEFLTGGSGWVKGDDAEVIS